VVSVGDSPILPLGEAADGGDELSSPILPLVEPADGGDELCSVAPPEVSAPPDGGVVADLDASGGTLLSVGGVVCVDVSAAKTGITPVASATTINARRRVMLSSFLLPIVDNALAWTTVRLGDPSLSLQYGRGLTLLTTTLGNGWGP
jgi:hypothetical protein